MRLPDAVLDAVANRVSEVSLPGRRTTRDQWHLTLQFLGDRADIDEVAAALEGIEAAPGRARIGGAGAFPDARHGRFLWLGMTEGASVLARIAERVADRTAALGYDLEPRPFRPHLTLARCRVPIDLRRVITAIGSEPVGPAWEVDAVSVFESFREADGARYEERATIALPGATA